MQPTQELFRQRRQLQNTALEVSPICLGTMTFGRPVRESDAIRLVQWAMDQGINFIDTADIYEGYDRVPGSPGGVAEELLGKALRGRRDKVVVTTKVGNPTGPASKGLGRNYILQQIEVSLRRLKTHYVDLYEMHRPDPDTPLAESIQVMVDLAALGKVRYWGVSNFSAPEIEEVAGLCDKNGWVRPAVCQSSYNWLKRDIEADILPVCQKLGIAVTPYQPLAGGLLSGKYRRDHALPPNSRAAESKWLAPPDERMYDKIELFAREAEAAGFTPARYAVHWLLSQPGVVSVVLGVKSIQQLNEIGYGERRPSA
jgi:aryl-alcohol dehydrogenase-like predicted oxidoreductase